MSEKIFGSKTFLVFGPKKTFGSKIFFGSKKRNVWSKKFFCLIKHFNKFCFFFFQKNLSKKMSKTFPPKNIFCAKIILGWKIFGLKKMLACKFFKPEKISGFKIILGPKKFFGPKNFLVWKFCFIQRKILVRNFFFKQERYFFIIWLLFFQG